MGWRPFLLKNAGVLAGLAAPGLIDSRANTAHEARRLLQTQSLFSLQKLSVFTGHPCQS